MRKMRRLISWGAWPGLAVQRPETYLWILAVTMRRPLVSPIGRKLQGERRSKPDLKILDIMPGHDGRSSSVRHHEFVLNGVVDRVGASLDSPVARLNGGKLKFPIFAGYDFRLLLRPRRSGHGEERTVALTAGLPKSLSTTPRTW